MQRYRSCFMRADLEDNSTVKWQKLLSVLPDTNPVVQAANACLHKLKWPSQNQGHMTNVGISRLVPNMAQATLDHMRSNCDFDFKTATKDTEVVRPTMPKAATPAAHAHAATVASAGVQYRFFDTVRFLLPCLSTCLVRRTCSLTFASCLLLACFLLASCLLLACFLLASCLLLACFLLAFCLLLACFLLASCLLLACFLLASCLLLACFLLASCLLLACFLLASCLLLACFLLASCLLLACFLLASCLLLACFLLASCLLLACFLLASCLLLACFLLASCLLLACFLLASCLLLACFACFTPEKKSVSERNKSNQRGFEYHRCLCPAKYFGL